MNTTNLSQRFEKSPEAGWNEGTGVSAASTLPSIDIQEYLRILWRQKKLIIATAVLVMMLGYVVVASLTPLYTASVLVEINPRETRVADIDSVLQGLPRDLATIQTEIKIIQSRKIAQRSISKLELALYPEFNAELRPLGLIKSWRRDMGAWIRGMAGAGETEGVGAEVVTGTEVPAGSEGSAGEEAEEIGLLSSIVVGIANLVYKPAEFSGTEEELARRHIDSMIDAFVARLTVRPEGRSRVARISFESENPKLAAAAANAVADFYVVAQLEAKFEATKRATTWLSERVEQLRSEVEVKEQSIEEYRAVSGLLKGGREVTLTDEKVSELNAQYVLELANLAEAEARLQQINRFVSSQSGIDSAIEVLRSPLIRELRTDESRVERQIAELSEEYGERHPTLINARAELRDLRSKIKVEVDRVVQGLRNEVAVARARSSSLARSLERAKGEVADLNLREVQLRALEREANASRTLLETLLERTKETSSQESFQQADASILSYAPIPKNPSSPKKKYLYPAILMASLLLGLSVAFLVEKLDLGFRSAEQISQFLGARSLGLVPATSKIATMGKSPQEYILENPQSAFGEAIRSLYTNILLSDVVQRPKVLLITSSLPREGKTTIAVSLARSLASLGQRVLVVDCDLRRSTTHDAMKMEPGPGLSECLRELVRPEDVIQVDEASGAHVLQAGSPHEFSPDQLDSGVMQRLLRNLTRRYDLVILDSAPVLAVADTFFLARLADKTVFLVRWAKTRRESVGMAVEQLVAAGANLSGVLLTMVDVKSHAQYGYADSGAYQGSLKKYYTG